MRAIRITQSGPQGLSFKVKVSSKSNRSQRGRALILDMKRAVPTHSHISQAYPRVDFEFLTTLFAAVSKFEGSATVLTYLRV